MGSTSHSHRHPPQADPYVSPPERSTLFDIDNLFRDSIIDKDKWYSFYQPIRELYSMAMVVKYLLPRAAEHRFRD